MKIQRLLDRWRMYLNEGKCDDVNYAKACNPFTVSYAFMDTAGVIHPVSNHEQFAKQYLQTNGIEVEVDKHGDSDAIAQFIAHYKWVRIANVGSYEGMPARYLTSKQVKKIEELIAMCPRSQYGYQYDVPAQFYETGAAIDEQDPGSFLAKLEKLRTGFSRGTKSVTAMWREEKQDE